MALSPLDHPALRPVEEEPPKESVLPPGQYRQALVRMRDSTQQTMKVIMQERSGNGWQILLCWGVSGVTYAAWYEYDPAKMIPWGDEAS